MPFGAVPRRLAHIVGPARHQSEHSPGAGIARQTGKVAIEAGAVGMLRHDGDDRLHCRRVCRLQAVEGQLTGQPMAAIVPCHRGHGEAEQRDEHETLQDHA